MINTGDIMSQVFTFLCEFSIFLARNDQTILYILVIF